MMRQFPLSVAATIIFGSLLFNAAGAQEITDQQVKEDIIARARDRHFGVVKLPENGLRGRLGSRWFTRLYAQSTGAKGDAAAPMFKIRFSDRTTRCSFDKQSLPAGIRLKGELKDSSSVLREHVEIIFACIFAFDREFFPRKNAPYTLHRDPTGYLLRFEMSETRIETRLAEDLTIVEVNAHIGDSLHVDIKPRFTASDLGLVLESLTIGGDKGPIVPSMEMRVKYETIDGFPLPVEITIRAKDMLAIDSRKKMGIALDDTLTIGEYTFKKEGEEPPPGAE